MAGTVGKGDSVADRTLGNALEPDVDRQLERVVYAASGYRPQRADNSPARVHPDARRGEPAVQYAIVRRLDAGLSDNLSGTSASITRLTQLPRADLSKQAEELAPECAPRVPALRQDGWLEAPVRACPLVEIGRKVARGSRDDDGRCERITAEAPADRRDELPTRNTREPCEPAESRPPDRGRAPPPVRVDCAERGGVGGDDEPTGGSREQATRPVEDRATRRLQADRAKRLRLRHVRETGTLDDLQRPKPEKQDREERSGEEAEHSDADVEGRAPKIVRLDSGDGLDDRPATKNERRDVPRPPAPPTNGHPQQTERTQVRGRPPSQALASSLTPVHRNRPRFARVLSRSLAPQRPRLRLTSTPATCRFLAERRQELLVSRAGPVGRGFAGEGVRGRDVVVRRFGARFQGFAGRGSGGALSRFGSRQPWLGRCLLRKTDVRVARLRVTTLRLTAKPVLVPNQGVLVKPNFESLNRASFGLPSIWEALQWCGAERLGHGVRIVDDITLGPDGSIELGRLAAFVRDRSVHRFTSCCRSACASFTRGRSLVRSQVRPLFRTLRKPRA